MSTGDITEEKLRSWSDISAGHTATRLASRGQGRFEMKLPMEHPYIDKKFIANGY